MDNNQFMVLGIKGFPVKDDKTEKDNPYIFNSLKRALEVMEETAKYESFAQVVKIEVLEELNFNCQN
jgi:hypothetical protein